MYHSNTTQSKWCIITHILQVDAWERRLFWRALTAFVVYLLFTSSTTLHMGHKLTFISLHFLFEWGCYHAAPCLGLLASLKLQLFCRPQHPAGFFCVVHSLDLLLSRAILLQQRSISMMPLASRVIGKLFFCWHAKWFKFNTPHSPSNPLSIHLSWIFWNFWSTLAFCLPHCCKRECPGRCSDTCKPPAKFCTPFTQIFRFL